MSKKDYFLTSNKFTVCYFYVILYLNITMMSSFAFISVLTGLNLFVGFEFRVIREFEDFHYGWYLSLSIRDGADLKNLKDQYFYTEESENIFLSSSEMDEIKNQINYLLESEDEADEPGIDEIDETDEFDSFSSDSS